jgi:hypothetical protein
MLTNSNIEVETMQTKWQFITNQLKEMNAPTYVCEASEQLRDRLESLELDAPTDRCIELCVCILDGYFELADLVNNQSSCTACVVYNSDCDRCPISHKDYPCCPEFDIVMDYLEPVEEED